MAALRCKKLKLGTKVTVEERVKCRAVGNVCGKLQARKNKYLWIIISLNILFV
jgi:hypothetical protein